MASPIALSFQNFVGLCSKCIFTPSYKITRVVFLSCCSRHICFDHLWELLLAQPIDIKTLNTVKDFCLQGCNINFVCEQCLRHRGILDTERLRFYTTESPQLEPVGGTQDLTLSSKLGLRYESNVTGDNSVQSNRDPQECPSDQAMFNDL